LTMLEETKPELTLRWSLTPPNGPLQKLTLPRMVSRTDVCMVEAPSTNHHAHRERSCGDCRTRGRMPVMVALALLLSASVVGQTPTSTTLQGDILSRDGSAIPRAHVELTHVPTNSVYRVGAGDNGHFFIAGLRVGGPYTLKVSHIGFAPHVRSGLFLRLLENTRVNIVLNQIDLPGEEMVITGSRNDTLSRQSQGASLHVGRDQLEMLPLPSGSLEDAYRMSPYMVGGSALGVNAVYNDVTLDGIGITDPFNLQRVENTPGGMQAGSLNLESLEEIRVDLSPFDVRRSGFTGAAIAAVSRSGSNVMSGSAHIDGAGGWLIGTNPDDGRSDYRGFADGRAGFRIGGPIVESKAFFFATGEMSYMRLPIERKFGASRTQGSTFSFPEATVAQLYDTLARKYSFDPGRMDVVPLNRQSANFFSRFDIALQPEQQLSVRYNFVTSSSDRPPQGSTVFAEGTLAENASTVHSVIAQLNSLFGPALSNELLVGFTSRRFTSEPRGTPFPFLDVIVTDRLRWWNHLTVGSEVGGSGQRLSQDHLEIHNTVSLSTGEHLLTGGLQGELHWFSSWLLSSRWGRYTFASLTDFLRSQPPSEYEYRYPRSTADGDGTVWRALQFGALLQDEWRVSPRVSLSIGVRVDLPVFPDHPKENSAVREAFLPLGYDLSTSSVPQARPMLSPRIGISIFPREDRSIQVRGGIGVFTGKIPYSWIGNLYDNTGLDYVHIKESANPPAFVADPSRQPVAGTGPLLSETAEVVVASKDFVLPQEVRWTIAGDFALPWNLELSLEGVYSRGLHGVAFQNINLKQSGTLNPQINPWDRSRDTRPVYGQSLMNARWVYSRNDSRFTDVMYMSNGNNGSSSFLTVQVQRRPGPEGIFASFGYSYAATEDLNSGTWDNAYDQWRYNPAHTPNEPMLNYSAFDRTHRLALALSLRQEWIPGSETTIGLLYTGVSGMPYSYVYDGDVNGDGESLNDLFYIPAQQSEILLTWGAGDLIPPNDPAYNEVFTFIAQDEYLSTHSGQTAERNGARTPWVHQLDLRLAQTLSVGGDQHLEIHAELLNLLNLLNASWGLVQSVPYQRVPVLRFFQQDQKGRPVFQWAPRTTPLEPDPLLSRWRIRVGMKYTF